jgi:hypothetical protein
MLAHGLTGHVEVRAKIAQRLAVFGTQLVQQFPPARIGQRFKHRIHCGIMICNHMVAFQENKFGKKTPGPEFWAGRSP